MTASHRAAGFAGSSRPLVPPGLRLPIATVLEHSDQGAVGASPEAPTSREVEDHGLTTDGRSERIRTSGPCLPKTVLYQAELHSERPPCSGGRGAAQPAFGGGDAPDSASESSFGGDRRRQTETDPRRAGRVHLGGLRRALERLFVRSIASGAERPPRRLPGQEPSASGAARWGVAKW